MVGLIQSFARACRVALAVSSAERAILRQEWKLAAHSYGKAIRLGGRTPQICVKYACALEHLGDIEGAIRAYRETVAIAPHSYEPHRKLSLLLKTDRSDEAVEAAITALCVSPREKEVAQELESLGISGAQLDARLTMAALRLGGPSAYEWSRSLGVRRTRAFLCKHAAAQGAVESRDWELAKMRLRELLAMDPNQPEMWVQLGHALKESGKLDGAVTAYRTAISWLPAGADAYLHLGHAYKLKGEERRAIDAYASAWRLQPWHPHIEQELRDYARWEAGALRELAVHAWEGYRVAGGSGFDGTTSAKSVSTDVFGHLTRREREIYADVRTAIYG